MRREAGEGDSLSCSAEAAVLSDHVPEWVGGICVQTLLLKNAPSSERKTWTGRRGEDGQGSGFVLA